MRDIVTTAFEVLGILLFAAAVLVLLAVEVALWAGFGGASAVLLGASALVQRWSAGR